MRQAHRICFEIGCFSRKWKPKSYLKTLQCVQCIMNYDNLKYFTWLGFIEFHESKFHNLIPADGKRKQSEARWDQLQGRVDRSLDNEATLMLLPTYILLYGLFGL